MKRKKRFFNGIVFKSLSGIIIILVIYSVIVSLIGFSGFTDALLTQYQDGAFRTADAASLRIQADRIKEYSEKGWESSEYKRIWDELDKLCNSTGVTFIYVIRPDLTDYAHITFLFSTINHDSEFTCYEFGYVRETTNDEYRQKYRNLYEGTSEQELVVRDRGYIETEPHITAMIPLKDSAGNTQAILCVQRQMDVLTEARNNYVRNIVLVLIILGSIVVVCQGVFLNHVCLRPVKEINKEASRFAKENTSSERKLTSIIHNRDEIGVLADSIDCMEERIVKYVDDLTTITAEKERIITELSLARKIQSNMLPNQFPPFPDRAEFDIFASMNPAKEVGGDFYDYFLVDEDHLCLVIADVSGKGVPAALFMMATKIIIGNYAKMGKSPGKILEAANKTICSNNKEDMFVTVWLGVFEISTGRLTAANAGHEYPVLKQPGKNFELVRDNHGFVIGGMDGMKYKEYEIELKPGSRLFVYTDGVPEASDSNNDLFGTERMIEALNIEPEASPKKILENVHDAVEGFVKDAEQFDDLTMLCFEYKGKNDKN